MTSPSLHNIAAVESEIKQIKVNSVDETTIEKFNSELDLGYNSLNSFKNVGSVLDMAPTWIYGTASPKRNISSSGSGLLLANKGHVAIASPEVIQNYLYPIGEVLESKILKYRETLSQVLNYDLDSDNFNNPLLVITGPNFIRHSNQIKGCAKWIGSLLGKTFSESPGDEFIPKKIKDIYSNPKIPENLLLSIRANLTNYNFDYENPILNQNLISVMTYEISQGMPYCRALLDEISEICPIVGETSDTITPQYLSDLFCLGLVSSTLIESQLHRELTSGTSYPIGFQTLDSHLKFHKDMYKHKIQSALDAMYASNQEHQFLSVTKLGTVAVVGTTGNDETFIIVEVNLQLSFEELVDLIENKIYKKSTLKTPRIMLDVGKISDNEYNEKLIVVKKFLTEENGNLKYKVMGVLIDSGDQYVPEGYKVELNQLPINNNGNDEFEENFEEMKRYFSRNRIHTESKCDKLTFPQKSFYEYFINADRFIQELNILSGERMKK